MANVTASIEKSIEDIINKINAKRPNSIIKADEFAEIKRCVTPTGCSSLDIAMEIGGLPIPDGKFIEIYGQNQSGKSTLALMTIGNMHRKYPESHAAYVDLEHTLSTDEDKEYAKRLGVDMNRMHIIPATNADDAMESLEPLMSHDQLRLAVFDSIPQLYSLDQLQRDQKDGFQMGTLSKSVSMVMHKMNRLCWMDIYNRKSVIFLNQIRDSINDKWAINTPGGNSMKFDTNVRIELRKTNSKSESVYMNENGETIYNASPAQQNLPVIGYKVLGTIIKSKVSPAGVKKAKFHYNIIKNEGIDVIYDTIVGLFFTGLMTRKAAHYYIGEAHLNGITQVARYLENLPVEELKALRDKIYEIGRPMIYGEL